MSSSWDIYQEDQEDQETKQCQIDVFQIFQNHVCIIFGIPTPPQQARTYSIMSKLSWPHMLAAEISNFVRVNLPSKESQEPTWFTSALPMIKALTTTLRSLDAAINMAVCPILGISKLQSYPNMSG